MTTDVARIERPRPGWYVVGRQELRDLWVGPRGLVALLAYSLLLSVLSYLTAGNADLNLLDARESVGVVAQIAIALGALAALVIGADAIAGERDRGTLEHLLLTPVARRDIVVGKLLSAFTMWLAAMVVAIPYIVALARGPGVATDAVLVFVVAGTLVAIALTCLGITVSTFASSNRVSLAASVIILIVLAAPSQLPGSASRGLLGDFLIRANPVGAGLKLTNRVLVDQRTWSSQWTLLLAPAIAALVFLGLAIWSSRRIRLETGQ